MKRTATKASSVSGLLPLRRVQFARMPSSQAPRLRTSAEAQSDITTSVRVIPSTSVNQAGAQRPCIDHADPMQAPDSGAIFQKRLSDRISRNPASGAADDAPTPRSGTRKKIKIAVPAVVTARISNMSRQPVFASTASAGSVEATAPSAPSMTMYPFTSATRSRGNQRTMVFRPAVRAAATPSPITARDAISDSGPVDRAKPAAPSAATRSSVL